MSSTTFKRRQLRPSQIARYFHLNECDLHLYKITEPLNQSKSSEKIEELEDEDLNAFVESSMESMSTFASSGSGSTSVPAQPLISTPVVSSYIMKAGVDFELAVARKLQEGHLLSHPTELSSDVPKLTIAQTIDAIRSAIRLSKERNAPVYILQPCISVGDNSGLTQPFLNMDRNVFDWRDSYPDILKVEPSFANPNSTILTIIDVKHSGSMKLYHRIQVAMYALMLRSLLPDESQNPVPAGYAALSGIRIAEKGEVWLPDQSSSSSSLWNSEIFSLQFIEPMIEKYLRTHISRILSPSQREQDLEWTLCSSCASCEFLDPCRTRAIKEKDVCIIPSASPTVIKSAAKQLGASDAPSLLHALVELTQRNRLSSIANSGTEITHLQSWCEQASSVLQNPCLASSPAAAAAADSSSSMVSPLKANRDTGSLWNHIKRIPSKLSAIPNEEADLAIGYSILRDPTSGHPIAFAITRRSGISAGADITYSGSIPRETLMESKQEFITALVDSFHKAIFFTDDGVTEFPSGTRVSIALYGWNASEACLEDVLLHHVLMTTEMKQWWIGEQKDNYASRNRLNNTWVKAYEIWNEIFHLREQRYSNDSEGPSTPSTPSIGKSPSVVQPAAITSPSPAVAAVDEDEDDIESLAYAVATKAAIRSPIASPPAVPYRAPMSSPSPSSSSSAAALSSSSSAPKSKPKSKGYASKSVTSSSGAPLFSYLKSPASPAPCPSSSVPPSPPNPSNAVANLSNRLQQVSVSSPAPSAPSASASKSASKALKSPKTPKKNTEEKKQDKGYASTCTLQTHFCLSDEISSILSLPLIFERQLGHVYDLLNNAVSQYEDSASPMERPIPELHIALGQWYLNAKPSNDASILNILKQRSSALLDLVSTFRNVLPYVPLSPSVSSIHNDPHFGAGSESCLLSLRPACKTTLSPVFGNFFGASGASIMSKLRFLSERESLAARRAVQSSRHQQSRSLRLLTGSALRLILWGISDHPSDKSKRVFDMEIDEQHNDDYVELMRISQNPDFDGWIMSHDCDSDSLSSRLKEAEESESALFFCSEARVYRNMAELFTLSQNQLVHVTIPEPFARKQIGHPRLGVVKRRFVQVHVSFPTQGSASSFSDSLRVRLETAEHLPFIIQRAASPSLHRTTFENVGFRGYGEKRPSKETVQSFTKLLGYPRFYSNPSPSPPASPIQADKERDGEEEDDDDDRDADDESLISAAAAVTAVAVGVNDSAFMAECTRIVAQLCPSVDASALNETQQRAFLDTLLPRHLSLIWGPPGTGKTRFIATSILIMLEAARRIGKQMSICVTAASNSAVNCVFEKIDELQSQYSILHSPLPFAFRLLNDKSDAPHSDQRKLFQDKKHVTACLYKEGKGHESASSLFSLLSTGNGNQSPPPSQYVVGGTCWSIASFCAHKDTGFSAESTPFDVLVVDEASQMLPLHSFMAFRRLNPNSGRLCLLGDHRQLPPVLQAPSPSLHQWDPSQLLLHRSLFESILYRLTRRSYSTRIMAHEIGDVLPSRLRKHKCLAGTLASLDLNFRTNQRICSFLARHTPYFPEYRVADNSPIHGKALPRLLVASEDDDRIPAFIKTILQRSSGSTVVVLHHREAEAVDARESGKGKEAARPFASPSSSSSASHSMMDALRFEKSVVLWLLACVNEAKWKLQAEGASSMFVVTPHHVQRIPLQRFKDQLQSEQRLHLNVVVDTVEKMQGMEADAVVMCFGFASRPVLQQLGAGREGAFLFDRNRFNVSASRAHHRNILLLSSDVFNGNAIEVLENPSAESGLEMIHAFVRNADDIVHVNHDEVPEFTQERMDM